MIGYEIVGVESELVESDVDGLYDINMKVTIGKNSIQPIKVEFDFINHKETNK